MMNEYRVESDSMGEVNVPKGAYWGAQTERSRQNFRIGGELMPQPLIRAFAIQKRCAAKVNYRLELLSSSMAEAIIQAAEEIINGQWDDQFPLVIWQTGSGTQTNMNMNEVIANRANEILGYPLGTKGPVHPNDHVNYGQSSNDSFPTAMHIAAVQEIHDRLLPALKHMHHHLKEKETAFAEIVKIGRTHLQDAVPFTLGQEFSGYAAQIDFGIERTQDCLKRLYFLAQGGTAIGTGLNCPPGFPEMFAKHVAELTKIPFQSAPNKFEALATHDALVELSGALNVLAVSAMKIANDIRWMASGPSCGLGEIFLPENEPGSSIMPGKVNPTQAEALTMVACQVMGSHTTVTIAGSQGNFELNVYKPVVIANILRSIRLLSDALMSFTDKCLKDIQPNTKQLDDYLSKTMMTATALSPYLGYDQTAALIKKATRDNIPLLKAAVDSGLTLDIKYTTISSIKAAVDSGIKFDDNNQEIPLTEDVLYELLENAYGSLIARKLMQLRLK